MRTIRTFVGAVALCALVVLMPLRANAGTILYAAQGQDTSNGGFYTLDPSTGSATFIGFMGASVTGLAVHPVTGVIYGSTTHFGAIPRGTLVTIDPTTGAATAVGSFALGSNNTLMDLSFDPVTHALYGWNGRTGELCTVDLTTGTATIIGGPGTQTGGNGLAFDPITDTLYRVTFTDETLQTVDKTTGAVTDGPSLQGFPVPFEGIPIGALAFNGSILYGTSNWTGELIRIDTTTGDITLVGFAFDGIDAIAFAPQQQPPVNWIPVPMAVWGGLALLGTMLGWRGRRLFERSL